MRITESYPFDNYLFHCYHCKKGYDPNKSSARTPENYCCSVCEEKEIATTNVMLLERKRVAEEKRRREDPQLHFPWYY